MALAKARVTISKPVKGSTYRERLTPMMSNIVKVAHDFSFNLGLDALTWTAQTEKTKTSQNGERFADKITLIQTLIDLVGADSATLYAATLYSAIRPNPDSHFNATYLDEIGQLFRNNGASGQYMRVRDIAINALQIRATELIALPHPITSVEEALNKPTAKEAEKLIAYFIMSKNNVREMEAFTIRATEWYLRLVDMRVRPERYTQEDRLNAYYYTDKFYAPFLEYLALQRLKNDPSYSPQAEGRGLYRLKTAMDEELIRQINPQAHEDLQIQLRKMLKSFRTAKKHQAEENNQKLFDLVSSDIERELRGVLREKGIPEKYVRVEPRLKRPWSLLKKLTIKRTDIYDKVGMRIIIDMESWGEKSNIFTSADLATAQKKARQVIRNLHTAFNKKFEAVPGRYKNFYDKPYKPDNGYRCAQNTLIIFGQPVEVQVVTLADHINNAIGSASHFFHALFADKEGGPKSGINISDMMKAFSDAGRVLVVRTPRDFYILKVGATVRKLAKRIHSKFEEAVLGVFVTDNDPTHLLNRVRLVDLDTPLRNGQEIFFETNRLTTSPTAG